jgi:hypothetical protein
MPAPCNFTRLAYQARCDNQRCPTSSAAEIAVKLGIPPEAHLVPIGSDPSRGGLSARNPMVKNQFLDSMQRKTEQLAKR